jgi:hypothetical protein
MFSVRGFAGGRDAARFSGFAADVIAGINIAATIAAGKRDGSSVEPQTFVIGELQKEGLTSGIVNRPIGNAWLQIPLWIKVPRTSLPLTKSPRRCFCRRLPPEMAANSLK